MCFCCRERKFWCSSVNKPNKIFWMMYFNSYNLLTAQYHRLTPVGENECTISINSNIQNIIFDCFYSLRSKCIFAHLVIQFSMHLCIVHCWLLTRTFREKQMHWIHYNESYMSEFPLAYDGMLFVSWCHSNWHTCFTWIACVRYNEQYYCLQIAHHIVISTHMTSNSTLPCLHKHTDPRAYTSHIHA